jgi:hypothetical protein
MTKAHNPHFDKTGIELPCRIGLIGGSGTGKSSWVMNFLARTTDTWKHIHVIYKCPEPLYEFLEKQLKGKNITFYTNQSKLPPINDLEIKGENVLVIFDDCVTDSDQQHQGCKELMIRGRKKGISTLYLSQSYYKIPKIIRLQLGYLIIFKLSSSKDLNMILSECSLGVEKNEIQAMYRNATKEKFNFIKIDLNTAVKSKKFSHNWVGYYDVESDSDSD